MAAIIAPMTIDPQLKLLAWSPDSKWLVVSDSPSYGGVMGLFLLSVETGEKRTLTLPPKDYDDVDPAFSLDGRHLAFARYRGGGTVASDLYVLNLSVDLQPRGLPNGLPSIRVTAPARFGCRTAEPSYLRELSCPVISAYGESVFPVPGKANPCRCRSIAALLWTLPGEAIDLCTRGRFPMSMSGVWIYHLRTGV